MDKDGFLGCLVFFMLSILFILVFALPGYFFTKWTCEGKYDDTRFSFFGGCKINYEGKYTPEYLYQKSFENNLSLKIK